VPLLPLVLFSTCLLSSFNQAIITTMPEKLKMLQQAEQGRRSKPKLWDTLVGGNNAEGGGTSNAALVGNNCSDGDGNDGCNGDVIGDEFGGGSNFSFGF
jgi:hypothetical protein